MEIVLEPQFESFVLTTTTAIVAIIAALRHRKSKRPKDARIPQNSPIQAESSAESNDEAAQASP
jgi:hypothetical protein